MQLQFKSHKIELIMYLLIIALYCCKIFLTLYQRRLLVKEYFPMHKTQ